MLRGRMTRRMIGIVASLSLLCTGAFAADAGEIIHEGTMNTYYEPGGTYVREFASDDGAQADAVEAVVVEAETMDEAVGETTSASGKQDAAQSGETAVSKHVYVTVDELSVRDTADVSGVAIGKIYQDALVEVVAETDSWYKIKYGDGYGYICRRYTLEDDGEADPAEPAGDDAEADDPNPAEQEPSTMTIDTEENAEETAAEAVVVAEENTADTAAKSAATATETIEDVDYRKSADTAQFGGMEWVRTAAQEQLRAISTKWHTLCDEN